LDSLATAYITRIKPTTVVGRSMEKLKMLENLDLQEGLLPLPKSLDRWSTYNLLATYDYTKRPDLKAFIASEFWWRAEMLQISDIRENT
jgi:hypothetical protein